MFGLREKSKMIAPERALRGRDSEMPVADRHAVLGTRMKGWAGSDSDGFE
jgi:peptide-methionine (S)-S-oxide reductase